MADEIDSVSSKEDDIKNRNIEQIRKAAKTREVEVKGACLFCDEPLPVDRRWCDSDCRDAWEKEKGVDRRY